MCFAWEEEGGECWEFKVIETIGNVLNVVLRSFEISKDHACNSCSTVLKNEAVVCIQLKSLLSQRF